MKKGLTCSVVAVLIIRILLADIVFAASTDKSKSPGQTAYRRYFNEKYSYSIDYPAYLIAGGEPDAHDGQSFSSPTKPLKMKVWGSYSNWMNGEEMALAEQRDWTLEHLAGDDLPAPKITYQAQGKTWFVISGTSSGNIFYERTIKEGDSFATVFITYPQSSKSAFASTVDRIARSLKG